MNKNIGKNISKNLCGKYNRKLLYNAKQSATAVFKTPSKRTFKTAIQRTAETAGDLIGNKIANRITIVSRSSPQNNSETCRRNTYRKIYISRRKTENY